VSAAKRDRGKFRSFLLAGFKHFIANQWKANNRLKRGGDSKLLSLDAETAEEQYRLEPADAALTPDKEYDRKWAVTVLEGALAQLEEEFHAKKEVFAELKIFLTDPHQGEPYVVVAKRLGMT